MLGVQAFSDRGKVTGHVYHILGNTPVGLGQPHPIISNTYMFLQQNVSYSHREESMRTRNGLPVQLRAGGVATGQDFRARGALELLGGPCTTAPIHTGVASSDHWLRTYCVSWRPWLTPAAQGPPGTLRPEE